MSEDYKMGITVVVAILVVLLSLISWGVYSSTNARTFDKECLDHKKSITYETVSGSTYKVCK